LNWLSLSTAPIVCRISGSINSYIGQLRQVDGFSARKSLCQRVESLFLRAYDDFTKMVST
jgi:hypothetical protein